MGKSIWYTTVNLHMAVKCAMPKKRIPLGQITSSLLSISLTKMCTYILILLEAKSILRLSLSGIRETGDQVIIYMGISVHKSSKASTGKSKKPMASMLSFKTISAPFCSLTSSNHRWMYSHGNFCRTLSTKYLQLTMYLSSLMMQDSYWKGSLELS